MIYVPTPPEVVKAMLDTAGVTAKDLVYDLGCGDGRIVIEAAKSYGARGWELTSTPNASRRHCQRGQGRGRDRVKFIGRSLRDDLVQPPS